MKQGVKFRLEDLPPHLRSQAERQMAQDRARKLKPDLSKPRKQSPIRLPAKREPNRTESRFNSEVLNGAGHYEALTFRVPSGRYTPDWCVFYPDGSILAVEVKGGYAFKSQSGASAKFKEAVELYPTIAWTWAKWDGKEWTFANGGRERGPTGPSTRQGPAIPGESPHVRPGACAGAREPQELIAAWNEWRGATCHKCAFHEICERSLSQYMYGVCFNAWLHSTKEDGK